MLIAQVPAPALPALFVGTASQRQNLADDLVQALAEHFAQSSALHLVVQPCIVDAHIGRQAALAPQVIELVLVGGEDIARRQLQTLGNAGQEAPGQVAVGAKVFLFVGNQRRVAPQRHTVTPPEAVERPARQLLTRVPLALTEMHQGAGRVMLVQTLEQLASEAPLVRAQRCRVPLGAVRVVDGNEGRLAAHGQAHIRRFQIAIHLAPEGDDGLPLLIAVGQRHPW
ncbi:hypothetical protein D3C76_1137440 [compost metagenome]